MPKKPKPPRQPRPIAPIPPPVVTPPPAVAFGIYRPEYPDTLTSVDAYEQTTGERFAVIHWYADWRPDGWKHAFSRPDLDTVALRGARPLITWEPWGGPLWETVLSGANDAYIREWALGLRAFGEDTGVKTLLRFAHEMQNQPNYPWSLERGNTIAEYKEAWAYLWGMFNAVGANAHVEWMFCPNSTRDPYEPIYEQLYPGDDLVDWLAVDIYNTGPALDWGYPQWGSLAEVFDPSYLALTRLAPRKPIALAELGCNEVGGEKAAWVTDALSQPSLDRWPQLRLICWFDIAKEADWRIWSSQAAGAAWAAAWRAMP